MLSGLLDGDQAALVRELHRRRSSCSDPLDRAQLGMALMFAGDPLGAHAFLSALQQDDPAVVGLALAELEELDVADIGFDGRPGRLPLEAGELAVAVTPHLEASPISRGAGRPGGPGPAKADRARWAAAAGKLLFPRLLPVFERLRNDPDRAVARIAIEQFQRRDEDAGTIAFIAGELVSLDSDKTDHGWRKHLCAVLEEYARRGGGRHRQAAAAAAAGCFERWLDGHVLGGRESLAAPDGLDQVRLISAMVAPRPPAVDQLLKRVLADGRYPVSLQVEALIGLDTLGLAAEVPKGPLIHRALCGSEADTTRSIVRLVDWGLLGLDELIAAIERPEAPRAATYLASRFRPTVEQSARLERAWSAALRHSLGQSPNDGGRFCCDLLERVQGRAQGEAESAEWRRLLEARLSEAAAAAKDDFHAQQWALSLAWMQDRTSFPASAGRRAGAWSRMWEYWAQEGMDWTKAAPLLTDAAVLDGWGTDCGEPSPLINPAAGPEPDALFQLLGHRLASVELAPDSRQPPYVEAWSRLASILRPVPSLVRLSQRPEKISHSTVPSRDEGFEPSEERCRTLAKAGLAPLGGDPTYRISFSHEDHRFRYLLHANPDELMDAVALLAGFNDFLDRIDHPQRLYALAPPYADDSWMFVIAANWRRFWEVNQQLRLPLLGVHPWR
ncbi:hypothetical protein [Pseudomarimonas salicorniae]|uniref:Uncharacterized protein n=1 Tax=Pseudomarimonas salicorniae TaxID=2933270 RepID=A0ABT0GLT8_9GAMM|nr:hypothetical protein [Lysobacter sp. CAU 1642]MCK7595506.1 hypothetical protein [Lysobacter sp. CAU 1642]